MSSQIAQSYIVHKVPAFSIEPITFNDEPVPSSCCQYKNKYGEYVCNQTKLQGHRLIFCINHKLIVDKWKKKMMHLLSLLNKYKETPHFLDSFMKLVYNLFNYIFIYKDYLVHFSTLTNLILNKPKELRTSLIRYLDNKTKFTNLKRNNKSLSIQYHFEKLEEIQSKVNCIFINQIEKSRSSLISNNIKLLKLSEIQLKTKHETEQSCVVITKDIKNKILSFIQ